MEKMPVKIVRYLLGVFILVMGLNKFFHFIAPPPPGPEMGAVLGALASTGYFFPLVGIVESLVGVALLANLFVPLALILLAPISVNIVCLHFFLDPAGLGPAVAVGVMNLVLGVANISRYQDILMPR